MSPKTLEAVFEGGKFRPLEQPMLQEQQHVLLTIVALKDGPQSAATCYDLAQSLGVIGVADDAPFDLSTNPAHLDGFGRQ